MSGRVAQRQNARSARRREKAPVLFLLLFLLAAATSVALLWAAAGRTSLSGREFSVREGLDPRAKRLTESPFARFRAENLPDSLSYRVNRTVELADGAALAPLRIGSPIQNGTLMRAEIILDEIGETVFSSGLLLPGSQIEAAALSRSLAAGEYPATVWFYAAAPADQTELGRVSEAITIKVLS